MTKFKRMTAAVLMASLVLLPQSVLAKELFTVGNSCQVLNNVYCHYIPWVYLK